LGPKLSTEGGVERLRGVAFVKHHLETLRQQTRDYLQYQDEKRAWESTHGELPKPDEIEPPEALVLLWTCRSIGGMWEAGGVGDQPHLLMNEFLTVQRAEMEYQAEVATQREALEKLHRDMG